MPENSNQPGESQTLGARVGAALIDTGVMVVLFVVMWVLSGIVGVELGLPALPIVMLVVPGLSLYAYKVCLEGWWNGQTVGKRLLNIKVGTERGDAITLPQAAIRNTPFLLLGLLIAIPLLGTFLFLVGYATFLLVGFLGIHESETNQRLSDRYAGTTVIKT